MQQNIEPDPQDQTPNQPKTDRWLETKKFRKNLITWVIVPSLIIAAAAVFILVIGSSKGKKSASDNTSSVQGGGPVKTGFSINYKEQNPDLAKIDNAQLVLQKYGLQLSPAQQDYLNKNKFLLLDVGASNLQPDGPRYYDEMLGYFDQLGGSPSIYDRTQADTVMVTPDIVLHAYHKFFDIALKDAEKNQLSPELGQFIDALYDNANIQMNQHSGAARDHYQKILAQITVARVVFENQAPPKPDFFDTPDQETAYDQLDQQIDTFQNAQKVLAKYSAPLSATLLSAATEELNNIYKATDIVSSPLFGDYNPDVQTDYTQYTPRSHYTESSQLRAYFRTMIYFGRNSYFFSTDNGITDAALLNSLFNMPDSSGIKPIDPWSKITAVTNFFAGQNDDLGYNEISNWIQKILPNSQAGIANADPAAISQLAANVWQLTPPKILSDAIISPNVPNQNKNDLLRETVGFRVFGQKFTFDAFLYSQLTAGQELSNPKLPSTPSALFVPAAFGDSNAKNYVQTFLKNDAGFSDSDISAFMQKFQSESDALNKVPDDQWNSSLGTAWLKVLSSLTHTYDQSYPQYMQSQSFADKQIGTFLGSYTELKHDTLLYAKQSYAELGGGGEEGDTPPPVVRGFVEPNIDFWNKLNDLIALNQKMFNDNGFNNSPMLPRLNDFQKQVQFYTDIAKEELQGTPISDDDYETLRNYHLSYMAAPLDGDINDPNQKRSAVIADVHTDVAKSKVLYEATAKPYLMLAIVGDANNPRLITGLAYNHYEFTAPLGGNRLTDDDWRKTVYENPADLPAKNFWYDSLIAK